MPYYMTTVNGGDERPVEAASQAAARNWAVRNSVAVRVMKPADFMAVGKSGLDIPKASAEDNAGDPPPVDPPAGDDNKGADEGDPNAPATTEDNQTKVDEPPAKGRASKAPPVEE